MIKKRNFIITSALLLILIAKCPAQFEPNPELEWFTIETQHFYIHYHKGTERTANAVAKIAEEIYGPITSLYNYRPSSKTSWIVNDESDYSNGATDYYGNRIEIASSALDFDLRGTHNWLRNVITHEYTHIVQIQAAMKFSSKMPSIYLQWLNYETERRPDVLYGYPNIIVSYPVSGVGVPAWMAEGVAQYQRQQLGYDFWDSHRDMILRMQVLGKEMLSWEEMGQFASVTTISAESVYNHGFALVRYIASKYGEDKLKEITKNLGDVLTFNSESAFRKAIGKSGKELYDEWKLYLEKDYNNKIKNLENNLVQGDEVAETGFANYFPKFSPDGKKISYLSNKDYDYGATSLYIHTIGNKKNDDILIAGVSGNYSWSPDGKKIVFARRNKPTIHEKSIYDIYEYDLDKKEENKITTNLRAHAPSFSNDGKQICFVINKDGTQNLYTAKYPVDKKIKEITQLTSYANGEQIYSPVWSPDGKNIIFDYSKNDARSIIRIDISSGETESLFEENNIDFRNPVYSKDGIFIYLSSDLTGIYNIYRYDTTNDLEMSPQDRKVHLKQITNAIGGAFMPSVDTNFNLSFSSFNSTGYKISFLKSVTEIDTFIASRNAVYERPERLIGKYASETDSITSVSKNKFNWEKLNNFEDGNPTKHASVPYTNVATPLFIIPVLRFDNYTKDGNFLDIIKPGLYFYSSDVLGRMGIFGGASINRKFERDLFLQFEYNNGVPFFKDFFLKKLGFVPHFTLAGYNITRKTNADLIAGIDTLPVDITYDLLQFDFAMAFKIINSNHNLKAGFTASRYSSKFDAFTIPQIGQIPSTSTNYFNGRDLSLTYTYNNFAFSKNDDINPIGRHIRLKYDYEFNYLNPTLVVNEQGNVVEEFNSAKFHRIEGDWAESFGLFKDHSIGFNLKAGSILGPAQDNFFDFYVSGFPGMKGYPFYAIGGNRYASANLTYRFPIAQNLDFNFLQFYFDKIFFSVYGDVGNAWYGKSVKLKDFKKDVGAEIRLQTYSYYVYPTSIALNAAYGIDEFSRIFPSTTNENQLVTYGKEWRFYFTMLFGFDFITDVVKRF
jgi:Tol biopolymer transport system component